MRWPVRSSRRTGPLRSARFLVDSGTEHAAGRKLRQKLVGVALLVEGLVEQILGIAQIELACERLRRAVGGDLVMLDALCGSDERGVSRSGVALALDHFLLFGDQPFHRLARCATPPLAELTEDLLNAIAVIAGLL